MAIHIMLNPDNLEQLSSGITGLFVNPLAHCIYSFRYRPMRTGFSFLPKHIFSYYFEYNECFAEYTVQELFCILQSTSYISRHR